MGASKVLVPKRVPKPNHECCKRLYQCFGRTFDNYMYVLYLDRSRKSQLYISHCSRSPTNPRIFPRVFHHYFNFEGIEINPTMQCILPSPPSTTSNCPRQSTALILVVCCSLASPHSPIKNKYELVGRSV